MSGPTPDLSGFAQEAGRDPFLWEFDLHPPPARTGIVLRRELLGRLADTTADLVVLTAPAGYGKTILLTQWAATLGKGRVAWLTLSESDNQAAVLLTRLAASVSRTASSAASNGSLVRSLAGAELAGSDDGRLIRALSKVDPPIVLILDNVQVLRSRESTGVIGQLVRQLQGHVHCVST